MKITFDHKENLATNIITFYFKPESDFAYTAGQYIELTLKHKNPDSRGSKRWFTLSSSPSDKLLTITTKITPDKGSSFKKALVALEPDHELSISGPFGDFVLPKLVQTPLIFVVGGIGITPVHSIFSWLNETGEKRDIKVIYGVSSEEEIIFQDTFKEAGQHVTTVVSNPTSAWGGETGRISAELILGVTKPSEDTLIYVSGPEPMVQSLSANLIKSGLEKYQVISDEFPNYEDI